MLVVHEAESGQHSWHVSSWHVWDVLQQAAPLAVHALSSLTHCWHVPSTHVLAPLQQARPLAVHALPSSTQVAVHTLLVHASSLLQQSVEKKPVVHAAPRAAQVWHLTAVVPPDVM